MRNEVIVLSKVTFYRFFVKKNKTLFTIDAFNKGSIVKVNFNNLDIFKVHLAKFTGGNISTKTFDRLLDKVEGVKNIPTSIVRALNNKAEKHTNLKPILSEVYYQRNNKIYEAKPAMHKETLQNNEITPEEFIKKAHFILAKLLKASGQDFKLTVEYHLKNHDLSYESTSITHEKLTKSMNELTEKEQILEVLNAQIQEETSYLIPNKEAMPSNYISDCHEEDLKAIQDEIKKRKEEVIVLNKQYLQQKKILIETIFDEAERNTSITTKKMKTYLTELRDLSNTYNSPLNINMRLTREAEENIKNSTLLINTRNMVRDEDTAVKDEIIKLPDTPTHKSKSTQTD